MAEPTEVERLRELVAMRELVAKCVADADANYGEGFKDPAEHNLGFGAMVARDFEAAVRAEALRSLGGEEWEQMFRHMHPHNAEIGSRVIDDYRRLRGAK